MPSQQVRVEVDPGDSRRDEPGIGHDLRFHGCQLRLEFVEPGIVPALLPPGRLKLCPAPIERVLIFLHCFEQRF